MSQTPLNPTEIRSIKRLIDQQLRSKDIYSQIRNILSDQLGSENESSHVNSSEHVLNVMKERGILQQLIQSSHKELASIGGNSNNGAKSSGPPVPHKLQQLLHFKIVKGKAFLEFDKASSHSHRDKFCICVQYRQQRFQTAWLDCHVEPTIDEDMLLVLNDVTDPTSAQRIAANVAELLQRSDEKIHIVVLKQDEDGNREYVAGTFLEWRKVLKTGLLGMSVELGSSEMSVPRGILELRLELLPRPKAGLSDAEIQNQFNIERSRKTKAEREFYLYSKQWFEEYRQIRPSHKNRVVKIYAESEAGGMKPVTSFVYPLKADRLLDSPSEAARFVSLISYERNENSVEGSTKEIWWETHTFLSKKKGDFENHAILLCSLLLGFGMDAYVCVGTDQKAGRLWVMTRSPDGEITFWESVTGARYKLRSKSMKYQTIGCVFNHESFYANIQRTDDVVDCQYDLENERHWKSMSRMKLSLVPNSSNYIALAPSSMNCVDLSSQVENELKEQIITFRKDLGFTTAFDREMSYMLSPAIFAYEQQRLLSGTTAVKQALEDFNDCIKNKVTEGHTFKAFPLQITNTSSRKIMNSITKSKICMDILKTQGDMVRFGLRVRAFAYPDDVVALWVMLSVRYQEIH